MTKRAERAGRVQGPRPPIHADAVQLRQLLFPMVAGIAATRTELMGWVHAVGLSALEELLRDDAANFPSRAQSSPALRLFVEAAKELAASTASA